MATKVSRKELREPDEFISFTQRLLTWVNEQKVALIVGALALSVAIVAVVAWQWYQTNVEKAASMAFVRAQEILDAPVVPEEEGGEVPPAGSYPTEEAKLKAALEEFEQVKKRHASTPVASLATYFVGDCQLRLGQYAEAEQTLKEYLASQGPDSELAVFALEGIAAALEAQGKLEKARAQYRRLTEPPFEAQTDRGLYHVARLAQKNGQVQEAVKTFNQILEKYPKTVFRQEIQGRLDRLPKIEQKPAEPEKPASDKTGAETPGKKTPDQAVEEEETPAESAEPASAGDQQPVKKTAKGAE